MKLLVFGTGEYYERFKKWIAGGEVVALLDNSPAKQHRVIDGVEVLSPREGVGRQYEAVVIMSFYIKSMKKQLMELGVSEKKIYHFYDLRKLIRLEDNRQQIQYYGTTEQELLKNAEKTVGLLSTDLALGGTAIALFNMAKVLKKLGYQVVFASMIDGPLRKRIEELDIPVVVDANLQLATMRETTWLAGFKLILCNAINYYIFLTERDLSIPTIWWLHDSAFFYDGVDKEILRKIQEENLKILSVGSVPEKALHQVLPEIPIEQLLYGVDDTAGRAVKKPPHEKICFVTIGFIEERKGQDILLRAVSLLEPEIRNQAVFYLIGQDTSLLAARIKEDVEQIPEIRLTGPVGREGIDQMLRKADVMICPSREDPMPTVAVEAMSYGVSCVVSNVTGTASYIYEKENGLIFDCENAEMLAQKIRWCIENRDRLEQMGENARQIYERYFSMEVFEKNVVEICGKEINYETRC
ncbi:MAG: glycosyltransferase family 4 protein [Lachnospiraceae bacterium]|nr:glycosyltransferase family 4 protein [Lachnospiraceae bacterium]